MELTHARTPTGRAPAQATRPAGVVAAALALLLLAACTPPTPRCRQAARELQRQETLAEMASPGGIDPEALRQARIAKRRACGG